MPDPKLLYLSFYVYVGTSATKQILQLIATMIAVFRLLQYLQLSKTSDNQLINFIVTFPKESSGNIIIIQKKEGNLVYSFVPQ